MNLPREGDVVTAVVHTGRKVYVFSKDWHFVLVEKESVMKHDTDGQQT